MFGDEAPIVIDIPRFHITAKNHVPLRKNSKLITNELKAVARLKAEPIEPTPEQVSGLKRSSSSIAAEADEPPQWAQQMMTMFVQATCLKPPSGNAAAPLPRVKDEHGDVKAEPSVGTVPVPGPAPGASSLLPKPSGFQPKGLQLRTADPKDDDKDRCI